MLWKNLQHLSAATAVTVLIGLGNQPRAEQLNAGAILNNMSATQRFAYLGGVIEGLAYARYLANNRDGAALSCLIDWFYENRANRSKLEEAFARYPDRAASEIIVVLTRQECGGS